MKWQLAAVLYAATLLSACGGGDSNVDLPGAAIGGSTPNSTPDDVPHTPSATDIGTPLGLSVSAIIGASGGQLSTADGVFDVIVPAGAFTTERTVSIQEITNEAHGANGRAFRISPEELNTPVPMTVRFHYSDEDLLGTTLSLLSVAYQDANRFWRVYKTPLIDAANKTMTVQTTHFSDWSMVAGAQLRPKAATVQVGASVELTVVHCEKVEIEIEDGLLLPTIGYECMTSPLDAFSSGHWSVNGSEGGSNAFGTITPDADRWSGKATYVAPTVKPGANIVSVSTQHELTDGFQLLVANITIQDAPLNCESLKNIERLNAELSFDGFNFTATAVDRRHNGTHAGRLVGTLQKIVSAPSLGLWMSYRSPLSGGYVSIADSYAYTPPSGDGFTATVHGSGAPHDSTDVPSFIGLKVNYDTCTFELLGSFTVDGDSIVDGDASHKPIGIGGLHILGQVMSPAQANSGFLQGSITVPATSDIERTGYAPLQIESTAFTYSGSTTARWALSPAP